MAKRSDRSIDVSSEELGVLKEKILYYGEDYISRPDTSVISAVNVRRRVPTGGEMLPHREKPFENGTLVVRYPVGTLSRVQGGVYTYVTTGRHSGIFNMYSGNSLNCTMAYPMGSNNPTVGPAREWYAPSYDADLRSQAEVRCLNKLDGKAMQDQKLDFGLVWAERHETVKLFADASVGLFRLITCLRRGDAAGAVDLLLSDFGAALNQGYKAKSFVSRKRREQQLKNGFRKTKNLLERFSDCALLWNLGISPLLKDLEEAKALLQTGLLTNDWDIKSVSRYDRVRQDVNRETWGNVSAEQTFAETHGYTVTLIARPLFSTRALLGRLGLTNLPNLVYQSTSGTFILDYFYALGPWLQAMEVPSRFEFKDGSWTQKVERIVTLSIKQGSGKPMVGSAVLNYEKRRTYEAFPRPLPPLSLREHQLTDKQVLNTALVAISRVKGMLRGS